jgi:hypothetical protein
MMQSSLRTAENTFNNANATQAMIDLSTNNLLKAIDSLVNVPVAPVVNWTLLDGAISEANIRIQSNYTALSWEMMQSSLRAAENTRNNNDVTQAMIDLATNNLWAAINALVYVPTAPVVPTTDWTALDNAITEANSRTQSNYTALSWAMMQSSLRAAVTTRNNANATQAMIDLATNNLWTAINNLK